MSKDTILEKLIVEINDFLHNRYFGKYRGIVVEVDEKFGKIKAKVPDVFGKDETSGWALPSVPFAGKKHGLVVLPEKKDGVWIEFEAGDPSRPIWSGCWWAKDELPSPGGKLIRALITTKGLQVVLDDDSKEIKLVHPGGAEIKLTDSEIILKNKAAKIKITTSGVDINDGAFKVGM